MVKPAKEDPEVSYVNDMQKYDLWTELKANFTLPQEEDPENPVKEQLIKSHALKKMEDLFRRWKNELKTFVDKEETPEFIGRYEKIRDHWPAFVAHKTSEKSKKMSATNKQNVAKKKHHHRTGSGGYLIAGLSGPRLRIIWLIKGSNQRQLTGQTVAGLGSSGLAEPWTLYQGGAFGRTSF